MNTFVFTYDPRLLPGPTEVPFITYPFQDYAILDLKYAINNGEDRLIEKSRDMGISWVCLAVYMHEYIFGDNLTFMLMSRVEELVDATGKKGSLMWKLDFMLQNIPMWMRPNTYRKHRLMQNLDTDTTIDGETTTGNAGRGDRNTSIFLDEFAMVQQGRDVLSAVMDATRSLIVNSTPKGASGAFAELKATKIAVLTLHWSLHPEKSKEIYIGGDNKLRSPWYDYEESRRSKKQIAEEQDINYFGSGAAFFDEEKLKVIRDKYVRPALYRGNVDFIGGGYDFTAFSPNDNGDLSIWCALGPDLMPADDRRYVMGVDVGTGSGSSYTIFTVFDCKIQEKVAEWCCNTKSQVEAAKYAVALGRYFKGSWEREAYMKVEANGPGQLFIRTVIEYGYSNLYYHKDDKQRGAKQTKKPGWWSGKETKRALLEDYRDAIEADFPKFINPSKESIDQCEFYVYENDGVEHSKSRMSDDPTDQASNHGDQVIADALAWSAAKFAQNITVLSDARKAPEPTIEEARPNTIGARLRSQLEDDSYEQRLYAW